MIFGFNTDIKAQETTYHIQTEVREQEHRLESQVFVQGRCVGKRSTAVPEEAAEEDIQELARAQHRWVVDAVREGFVADVLDGEISGQDAADELVVQFLGSRRISEDEVILRFRVLVGGMVASNAHVEACWCADNTSGVMDRMLTNDAGIVETHVKPGDGSVDLQVTARVGGRETSRRFLVKSAK